MSNVTMLSFADVVNTTSLKGAESEWAALALSEGSGTESGRWETCHMTIAQQRAIFASGLKRGQGMLPLPSVKAGEVVWCHAQEVQEHHQITPSVYWTRQSDGAWCYESCTTNTHARVSLSGRLAGQTLSTLARAAGNDVWIKGEHPVPDAIMNVASDELLSAAYEAALAAMESVSTAQAAYAAGGSFSAVCEAQDAMRRAAAFALAMGASQWVPWRG